MRGSEPGDLLKIIVALLEHQVLPAVESKSARSTLLLTVGMLDNLAERVEERQDLAERDRELAEELLTAMPATLAELVDSGPPSATQRMTPLSGLIAAFRALVAHPDMIEDDETDAWLAQCQVALRGRNSQEVALLNPTRYLRSQNA